MLTNVDSSKIAYLVGFLSGDGNFCGGYGKRTDRLSVTTTDLDFVHWVDKHILPYGTDNAKLNDNPVMGIYAKQESFTKTFPASLTAFLSGYGIMCLKRTREIKNILHEDMRHWLRGFLDADGCITYGFRKDRGERLVGKVCFTHQSEKLLSQVSEFLLNELGIKSKISPKGDEDCLTLAFSKLSDMKVFGDFIYKDKGSVVLNRKYETYKSFVGLLVVRVAQGETFPQEFMLSDGFRTLVGSFSRFMFVDASGKEFASAKEAADYHNIDKLRVHRRCKAGAKGWSRRDKTEAEKQEYSEAVNLKIREAFKLWLEDNKDFYKRVE